MGGLGRVHARVRCTDGNICHFDLSQLSLKQPKYEDTTILSIVGADDRLAVFNLSDHDRKIQCEATLDCHHSGMSDSHLLEGVAGFTTQDPYTSVPAVKKLCLAIRTAEPIGSDRAREVTSQSQNLRREINSVFNPTSTEPRREMQQILNQWLDRIRANRESTGRRVQAIRSEPEADFSGVASVLLNEGAGTNNQLFDRLRARVDRRTQLMNNISQNLEDPDLNLSQETRVRLQDELRTHRMETESDLMLLRQSSNRSSVSSRYLPSPGDNPNYGRVQRRGSAVSVSSNNTTVNVPLARSSSIADEVDRILGGLGDIPI